MYSCCNPLVLFRVFNFLIPRLPQLLFNPFLASGPVESPKLMRRVMRESGIAPAAEQEVSDDEIESDEEWSDEDAADAQQRREKHRQKLSEHRQRSQEQWEKRRDSTPATGAGM